MTSQTPYVNTPKPDWLWLRRVLPKRAQPVLRGLRKRWQRIFLDIEKPYWTVYPYTQVNEYRLRHLVDLAETIEREEIPGDIVECGVLDGGAAALLALTTARSGRTVHLFDAWRGMPETTAEDGAEAKAWSGEAVGSRRRVVRVMNKLGIDPKRLVFHEGWFSDTFPTARIDRIALLNIDADFYDAVRLCLDTWYPKLSPGGFVHLDDYAAFLGCRKAVDEFLERHPDLRLDIREEVDNGFFFFQAPASSDRAKGNE